MKSPPSMYLIKKAAGIEKGRVVQIQPMKSVLKAP